MLYYIICAILKSVAFLSLQVSALFLFALLLVASIFGAANATGAAEHGSERQLLQSYGRRLQGEGSERELLQAYGRRLSQSEGVLHRVRRLFGN
jgi:hypothetical protein